MCAQLSPSDRKTGLAHYLRYLPFFPQSDTVMGCSASKELSRKRTARECWYAPVSRSASAPIQFVADEDDNCSPAATGGEFKDRNAFSKDRKSSLASLMQAENAAFQKTQDCYVVVKALHESRLCESAGSEDDKYECKPRKRAAIARARSRFNSTLMPVAELLEHDYGAADTRNKDERRDEVDRVRKPARLQALANRNAVEKSQSFSRVQGLDSCFTELKPLVWRKYFSDRDKQTDAEFELKKSTSTDTNDLCTHLSRSNSSSSAKSSPRTPSEGFGQSNHSSPLNDAIGSPLESPVMGSGSPIFDSSLLAKFEQAVDAVSLQQDDVFIHNLNGTSMSISSPALHYHARKHSQASSDGESPQSVLEESLPVKPHDLLDFYNNTDNTRCDLDNFEIRCPPNGENKVVLYFTSLRGIRKTYDDCYALRRILQGMGLSVDERDVWMHSQFREELTQLLDKQLQVPRLFIKGRYIGGVEETCQLNEDGLLADLVVGMQTVGTFRKMCEGCADMRFVPCFTCHGSCKLLDDFDQMIRCRQCNENGLMLCPICSS